MHLKSSNLSLKNCEIAQNKFEYFSLIFYESSFEKRTNLIIDKISFINNLQLRPNYYTPLLPIISISGCNAANISNLYFKSNDIGKFNYFY